MTKKVCEKIPYTEKCKDVTIQMLTHEMLDEENYETSEYEWADELTLMMRKEGIQMLSRTRQLGCSRQSARRGEAG